MAFLVVNHFLHLPSFCILRSQIVLTSPKALRPEYYCFFRWVSKAITNLAYLLIYQTDWKTDSQTDSVWIIQTCLEPIFLCKSYGVSQKSAKKDVEKFVLST